MPRLQCTFRKHFFGGIILSDPILGRDNPVPLPVHQRIPFPTFFCKRACGSPPRVVLFYHIDRHVWCRLGRSRGDNVEQVPQGTSAAAGSWRIAAHSCSHHWRTTSRSRRQRLQVNVGHAWNHESCTRLADPTPGEFGDYHSYTFLQVNILVRNVMPWHGRMGAVSGYARQEVCMKRNSDWKLTLSGSLNPNRPTRGEFSLKRRLQSISAIFSRFSPKTFWLPRPQKCTARKKTATAYLEKNGRSSRSILISHSFLSFSYFGKRKESKHSCRASLRTMSYMHYVRM